MKKMQWDVTIGEAENGYLAKCGCKLFVFTDRQTLLDELVAYMDGKDTALSEQIKKEMPTIMCQSEMATPNQLAGEVLRR